MPWGAIAGAVGGVVSSLIGGSSARSASSKEMQMQRETNAANAYEAALNRMWQEGMSNTAHRREMVDLYSAGLNPILTATGGHGASTPSGSQAVMESPGKGLTANTIAQNKNYLEAGRQVASSINSYYQNQATQAQTRLADQQTATSATQAQLQKSQQLKTDAETLNVINSNPKIQAETKFIEGMIKLNSADAMKREQEVRNLVQELETSRQLALKHAKEAELSGNKSLESKKIQEAQELQLKIERAANEAAVQTAPWRPYMDTAQQGTGIVGDAVDIFKPKFWNRSKK